MRTTPKALLLAGILAQAGIGCAGVQVLDIDRSQVIPVSTLTPDSAAQRNLGKALQEGKEVVVFIPKGQSVPINVNLAVPMASLAPSKNNLVFTRDTYLLFSNSRFMISPDAERWAPIGDFAAQKDLYGYKGGHLLIGFGVTKEAGPIISLDMGTGQEANPPQADPPAGVVAGDQK